MSRQIGLIAAVVLFMLPSPVRAQEAVDMRKWSRLIYEIGGDLSLHGGSAWDENSRWFWTRVYQYDTQTGQLIENSANQRVRATLPTTTLATFGIDISEPRHPRAYYSVSPNGEYVAYSIVIDDDTYPSGLEPECITREIRIGHIPSLTVKAIDLRVRSGVEFDWYGDSAGLWISNSVPCASEDVFLYGYVTSFSPDLTSLHITNLLLSDISIDGIEMEFRRVTHVSRDGTQVLLLGVSSPTGEFFDKTVLVLLDTKTPTNTRILFREEYAPIDAFFKYGDESKLLIIMADGLIEYDVATSRIIMLDSTFNGVITQSDVGSTGIRLVFDEKYYVLESTISPNGRWLIYAHWDAKTGRIYYYVVDLAEALYSNGAAGNAVPTDLPTLTPVCSSDGC